MPYGASVKVDGAKAHEGKGHTTVTFVSADPAQHIVISATMPNGLAEEFLEGFPAEVITDEETGEERISPQPQFTFTVEV